MNKQDRKQREREIAMFLDQCQGKQYTDSLADRLEQAGFIVVPDAAILRRIYKNEEARKLCQGSKKYRNRDDTAYIDFLNLVEVEEVTDEDGVTTAVTKHYYKKAQECTWDEARQHLAAIHKKRRYWDREYRRYLAIFSRIHGLEFQLSLNFEELQPAQ